jgi:hypothetical protein
MDWFVINIADKKLKDLTKYSNLQKTLIGSRRRTKWTEEGESFPGWSEFHENIADRETQAGQLLTKYDGSEEQSKLTNKYENIYFNQWKDKITRSIKGKISLWIYSVKRNKQDWFITLTYDILIRPITCSMDERISINNMYQLLWDILINMCVDKQQACVIKTHYEVWKILKKEKIRLMLFYYSCCTFFYESEYKGNCVNDIDDLDLSWIW